MGISLVDVTGVAGALGGVARDIRAAITGKEVLTAEERAALAQQVYQLELSATQTDLALAQAQATINAADAASGSNFRGGWRPAIGWVCGIALLYQFLLRPILPWMLAVIGHPVPMLPDLNMETLTTLLLGMLGLGGMRTAEKIKGIK